MEKDIQTLPVSGWDIKFVIQHQAVIFTPRILPHMSATIEESESLSNLLLSRQQVEHLIDALKRSLVALGDEDSQGAPFLDG